MRQNLLYLSLKVSQSKLAMYFPIVLFAIILIVSAEETCLPPQELTNNENSCLDSATTLLQRVQHQATGLFASAKRKLGIDPNAEEDPLNCNYYLCILRNLGMVNGYGILQLQEIKNWLARYVPDDIKDEFILHATTCLEVIGKNESNTNCDRSLDYVKCLHDFQKYAPKMKNKRTAMNLQRHTYCPRNRDDSSWEVD